MFGKMKRVLQEGLLKQALKAGLYQATHYIREAQGGYRGLAAKARIDWWLAHASALGLIAGGATVAAGLYFGPDSPVVAIVTGTIAPWLAGVGFLPKAWAAEPERLEDSRILQALSIWSVEIGAVLTAWWTWTLNECNGTFKVFGEIALPCTWSTLACSLVFGTCVHIGLVSRTLLAPRPLAPLKKNP